MNVLVLAVHEQFVHVNNQKHMSSERN